MAKLTMEAGMLRVRSGNGGFGTPAHKSCGVRIGETREKYLVFYFEDDVIPSVEISVYSSGAQDAISILTIDDLVKALDRAGVLDHLDKND